MAYPGDVTAVQTAPTTGALGSTSPTHSVLHDQYRTALNAIKTKIDSGQVTALSTLATGSGNAGANTTAIQAALDAAESAGGGYVVIPVGTYYINNTLNLGSRVVLAGLGWGSMLFLANGTASAASPKPMVKAKANTNYVGVEDLALYGNKANQTDTNNASHGVDFSRSTTEGSGAPVYDGGMWVRNVMAFDCQGMGFRLDGGATTMRVHGCYAYHNSLGGYWGKTDCIFTDSVAGNNGGVGFYWYAGTSIIASGLKSFGNPGDFIVSYCNTVMMSACQSEDFDDVAGFRIGSSSHVTLVGCQTYRSKSADGNRAGLWLEDDGAGNLCHHITVRGFAVLGGGATGINYALVTRNLGNPVDIELVTETILTAQRNHLSGTDQGRIVINGGVVLDTITTQRINAQTGTTYTPVLTDINGMVKQTNASAITTTLPQDSALAVPVGARIDFAQGGAGQITFVAGTGATVHGYPGLKVAGQYGVASAYKEAANTWLVTGALSA